MKRLLLIGSWLPQPVLQEFDHYFAKYWHPKLQESDQKKLRNLIAFIDKNGSELAKLNEQQQLVCNNISKVPSGIDTVIGSEGSTAPQSPAQDKINQALALDYLSMVNDGDWDKLLVKFRENMPELSDSQMLDMALMLAIQNRSEFSKLKPLLEKGAQLDKMAILLLISQDNLPLIEQLRPYGLDLHATDPQNHNGLYYVISTGSSAAMFDYLLQHNVAITPESDLLGLALTQTNTTNTAHYVTKFVEFGVIATANNKAQLQTLRSQNQSLYDTLAALLNI